MILQPFVDIFFYLYMLQIVDTFVFNKIFNNVIYIDYGGKHTKK